VLDWLAERRSLTVVLWDVRTDLGEFHSVMSRYVERYVLPMIGPTATIVLRRLGNPAASPSGSIVDLDELSVSLGLGTVAGRHATLRRAIHRLVVWRLATVEQRPECEVLAVRTRVPRLTDWEVRRLPPALRVEHCREFPMSQAAGR
jgi:hypothetical protein